MLYYKNSSSDYSTLLVIVICVLTSQFVFTVLLLSLNISVLKDIRDSLGEQPTQECCNEGNQPSSQSEPEM